MQDNNEIECYYYGKRSHRIKGKLKELTNVLIVGDPLDTNNGDPTNELAFFTF